MKEVNLNRAKLLEIVKKNRDGHRELYEKAVKGYVIEAKQKLTDEMQKVLTEDKHHVNVFLTFPEDHTDEYDRVVEMLEMSVDEVVTLTQSEFACYVQDDWGWKQQWIGSNTAYLSHG